MSLGQVAGIFSRYFIVGLYVPSFFVLGALAEVLSKHLQPHAYVHAGSGAKLAIIFGAGLLLGLVLLGLHYSVLRLLEGYPLEARRDRWYVKPLYSKLLSLSYEKNRFTEAHKKMEGEHEDRRRKNAQWHLDQRFPRDGALLPTAFGNVIRAFERHSQVRWGLNGIAAWSRIQMLLSDREVQVLSEAESNLAFCANGCLLAGFAVIPILTDAVINGPRAWYWTAVICIAALLVAILAYGAAVGAAMRWGDAVRAILDLHRHDLYERLGLRSPVNFTDEREVIAPALNETLLLGDPPIPDDLARG